MSKLLIAAAGAGKTTYLVNKALSSHEKRILITTFTDANTIEIKKKFYEKVGCIPENIDILPWFTFLLKDGVRPYQGVKLQKPINGIALVNQSRNRFIKESDFERYYLNSDGKVYSDKLAKLVYKLNEVSGSLVVNRLKKIYSVIYIDEAQDMAGYDFEIIKDMHTAGIPLIIAGDPRQTTYATHWENKNNKYQGHLKEYIVDKKVNIEIDETTLGTSYRNNADICALANQFYPDMQPAKSGNHEKSGHDGVFFVDKSNIAAYCSKFNPVILRFNQGVKIDNPLNLPVYNFGESKGLTFERVLIYPTNNLIKVLLKNEYETLKPATKAKCYVAITRAKFSVAVVLETKWINKFRESYPNRIWREEELVLFES